MDPPHRYTATPDILWLPQSSIHAKVTPNTATGCTFTQPVKRPN
jgi:hypothetical protein